MHLSCFDDVPKIFEENIFLRDKLIHECTEKLKELIK